MLIVPQQPVSATSFQSELSLLKNLNFASFRSVKLKYR